MTSSRTLRVRVALPRLAAPYSSSPSVTEVVNWCSGGVWARRRMSASGGSRRITALRVSVSKQYWSIPHAAGLLLRADQHGHLGAGRDDGAGGRLLGDDTLDLARVVD